MNTENEITISADIRELRGALSANMKEPKDRLHQAAKKKLRSYHRL